MEEEDARDYLNKIIQVRFELPPIQEKAMQPYIESAGDLIQAEVRQNWERIVAGAEVNPRKVKAFINDLNLQWAILRNTERAKGVQHADFTCWHIIRHIAPDKFWLHFANLPDHEIQLSFLNDALQWAKGSLPEEKIGLFREYQEERRLKKVLSKLDFSPNFNAQMLKEFFYSLAAGRSTTVLSTCGVRIVAGAIQIIVATVLAFVLCCSRYNYSGLCFLWPLAQIYLRKPASGRIAVKVINHLGDEVMKVFRVE